MKDDTMNTILIIIIMKKLDFTRFSGTRLLSACVFLLFPLTTTFAQIPNHSFENWDTVWGCLTPAGWQSSNLLFVNPSFITCQPSTDCVDGNYSVELTTLMTPTAPQAPFPGNVINATYNSATFNWITGFPFQSRPDYLKLYVKYSGPQINSSGMLSCVLSLWDPVNMNRKQIAYRAQPIYPTFGWIVFNMQLTYFSGLNPDTCVISLSSSLPIASEVSAVMKADSLWFSGITTSTPELEEADRFSIYPNPAGDFLNIQGLSAGRNEYTIAVYNSLGSLVLEERACSLPRRIELTSLNPGIYQVVMSGQGVHAKRTLIKQ